MGGDGVELRQGGKVGKDTRGSREVPRSGIKDGVFFGKPGRPVARVREVSLSLLWGLEDRAREGGGGGSLFRGRRLSVWISKAAAVRGIRSAETFHPREVDGTRSSVRPARGAARETSFSIKWSGGVCLPGTLLIPTHSNFEAVSHDLQRNHGRGALQTMLLLLLLPLPDVLGLDRLCDAGRAVGEDERTWVEPTRTNREALVCVCFVSDLGGHRWRAAMVGCRITEG